MSHQKDPTSIAILSGSFSKNIKANVHKMDVDIGMRWISQSYVYIQKIIRIMIIPKQTYIFFWYLNDSSILIIQMQPAKKAVVSHMK
jgi:hypothetical protein